MRIVFTGGPCTGKTTTFDAFKKKTEDCQFYEYVPELARDWLKHFEQYEPHKHPANDRFFFQGFMETLHKKNWLDAGKTQPWVSTIYDRSLVDEIAYRNFFDFDEDGTFNLEEDCKDNYTYDIVFFFPFWEQIYTIDEVRNESLRDAEAIDLNLRNAYEDCGYDVIEVPFGTVEERIEFILNKISEK